MADSLLLLASMLGALWVLSWGIRDIVLRRRDQRVDRLRQAAATRAGSADRFVAAEQPVPRESIGPLPLIIQLKPKWSWFLVHVGLLAMQCTLLLGSVVYAAVGMHSWNTFAATLWPGVVGFTAIFSVGILADMHQSLKVTHEQLTVRSTLSITTIRWDEARLFAIGQEELTGEPPIRYELSSSTAIVHWVRVRRSMPFSLLLNPKTATQPSVPFDEYDQQMDSLLALIAAKTGLPLYDLRSQ